jgi:hypothetical protein
MDSSLVLLLSLTVLAAGALLFLLGWPREKDGETGHCPHCLQKLPAERGRSARRSVCPHCLHAISLPAAAR